MPFDGTPISDPAIELLEKVRNLLKEEKWVQGKFVEYDPNGEAHGYCIVGALNYLSGNWNIREQALTYLGFNEAEDIYEWNDADRRTKTGVLRRLTLRINKAKQSLLLKV